MNKLDRRDRRRATKIMRIALKASDGATVHWGDLIPIIAAALKKEREDSGTAAMWWFLFSAKDRKAREAVKRKLLRGAKVSA